MNEENNVQSSLGGFEAVFDTLSKQEHDDGAQSTNDTHVDDEELQEIKQSKDPIAERLKSGNQSVEETQAELKDSDNLDVTDEQTKRGPGRPKNAETIENEQLESEQISNFFDVLADGFGWNANEIPDDQKPKDVKGLVDYLQDVIDYNSKPRYANDEIAKLDQFVHQGGNLQDYFRVDNELNLDNIDLEDETNQKAVVKQLLKEKGFNDSQIDKKLQKYEEVGILEDEAQDAIDDLREINELKKQQLLEQQQQQYAIAMQQQQQFYNSVVNGISQLSDIRGIAIPEADKRDLLNYIFVPDANGVTQYQKDYQKNIVQSLIESAYFTKHADKLLNSAKRIGSNAAIDRFKRSLRPTVNTKSAAIQNDNNDGSIWNSAARMLRI